MIAPRSIASRLLGARLLWPGLLGPRARVSAGLLAGVLAAGCTAGDDGPAAPAAAGVASTATTVAAAPEPAPDSLAWPGETWTSVSAEEAGFDRQALDEMAAAAERAGSECLVVTKAGRLVGEWYWQGFGPETQREVFSVTKSVTSTLVGIAQDRGLLDIDEPVAAYVEEWRGSASEDVTIRNLLSNDSGRFQDFDTDYIRMAVQAKDKTAFAIALEQQHEPGTRWVYNNAAIQVLEAVLEEATGLPVGEFAEEALFDPIGMRSTINTDAAGNALTFMGVQASCLDLARFGLLFLRGGSWEGEQVVSAAWVAEATAPSQELNPGYGHLWWLDREDGAGATASGGGEARAGSPVRTYAAVGLHDQLVGVYPDEDVVASRLGADAGADGSGFGLGELNAGVRAALGRGEGGVDAAAG